MGLLTTLTLLGTGTNTHAQKKVDVFIKLFATIEVEVDEDGDILSDLKDEAEEQLEDIIQRRAYQLEEVEVD